METKSFGSIKVTADDWKGIRIYFKFDGGKQGHACWDIQKKQWVPVHKEVGASAKAWLAQSYNLK